MQLDTGHAHARPLGRFARPRHVLLLGAIVLVLLCAGVYVYRAMWHEAQLAVQANQQRLAALEQTQHALRISGQLLRYGSVSLPPPEGSETGALGGGALANLTNELLWTIEDLRRLHPGSSATAAALSNSYQTAMGIFGMLENAGAAGQDGSPQAGVRALAPSLGASLLHVQDLLRQELHAAHAAALDQLGTRLRQLGWLGLLSALCAILGFIYHTKVRWALPMQSVHRALQRLAHKTYEPSTTQRPGHWSAEPTGVPALFAPELSAIGELLQEGDRLALEVAQHVAGRRISAQLLELTKTIPGVVFQYEYTGDDTRVCHFVSAKVQQFFGDRPGTKESPAPTTGARSADADDAVPIALTRSLATRLRQLGEAESAIDYDTEIDNGSGPRWIRTLASVTTQSSGSILVNGVWLDVTETVAQEQALALARTHAEQVADEKARLLAVMSHEIRTPLNGVLGMAQLALKSELQPPLRERIENIHNAGHHLMEIVNDVLDYSKIDSGLVMAEQAPFSLQALVAQVAELLAPRAAEKSLEFWIDVPHTLTDQLVGDAYRIRQILINYVSNAIKFTPAGEVSIRVQELPDQGNPHVMLQFEVRDTGIGIAPDEQRNLFQAFRQADVSITRRYGGTGLGLAISAHLAKLLGGQTGLQSSAGQGSVFWFTAQLTRGVTKPAPASWLNGKRVLLLESHPAARSAAAGWLGDHFQCHVMQASTGKSGLQQLRDPSATRPDLLLLAHRLADMDAAQFLQELTTHTPAIPHIWIAATVQSSAQCHALAEVGVTRVLEKPLSIAALARAASAEANGMPPQRPIASPSASPTKISAPAPASHTKDHPPPAMTAASVRILVVDDNALNRTVAAELLQSRHDMAIHIDFAEDGLTAVSMVSMPPEGTSHDAILMDLEMPGLDGFSATRQIRLLANGLRIPIFAMSAHRGTSEMAQATEAGISDFIHKPIVEQQLWDTLARWGIGASAPATVATGTPPESLQPPSISDDAASGKAIFDERAWDDLHSTLAPARAIQLANQFITQSAQQLQELEHASQAHDHSLSCALLHKISGTAGTFGLVGLGALAADLHTQLKASKGATATAPQLESLQNAAAMGHQRLKERICDAQTTGAR